MSDIYENRKNQGNRTYRIRILIDESGQTFFELEKLMKKRSKEQGKNTTKERIEYHSFNRLDNNYINTNVSDPIMLDMIKEAEDYLLSKNEGKS
ncbi:hypothetical protein ACOZB2_03975 [Pantoea endophytica]|uniref:Uncharacterized protein n=1 Tax=Pantoea sp. BJ2 TaxID=3141322 RepID=A0AAU7U430_9GAMM